MIVNCVVVTYNRLALLKECLDALEKQTFPIQKVIIVDNCSTDDTPVFLATLSGNPRYKVIRPKKNLGGAGGFSLGIKESVLNGCDYTWVMDDDTIPASEALAFLVKAAGVDKNVGFACSQVNWLDGKPHIMNRANLCKDRQGNILQASNDGFTASRCETCTFVSVLISSEAVYKVGLPIKEFFIWCDDMEYTLRITEAGFHNYYTAQSVVLHKTASNYYPAIDKAPASMAWRFYYQARNTCYFNRKKYASSKFLFYLSVLNKYRVYRHRLGKRKDGDKEEFLKAVKKGCLDGLKFNPAIEYLKKE